MTQSNNNQENELRPLLTDEEFDSLIEAEYIKNNRPVNDADKKRVWEIIHTEINSSKQAETKGKQISRKWIPYAAAAILIASILPMYLILQFKDPSTRMKGVVETPIIHLWAYSIDTAGQLTKSNGRHEIGSTIVFKYDVSHPVALALLMAKADNPAEVRFTNNAANPGDGVLLEKNGNAYGYIIEPQDHEIRFCVIAAENENILAKRLISATKDWSNLASESCTTITINDS